GDRPTRVAGGMWKENPPGGTALARRGGVSPPHRDASIFQPRRQRIERRRVRNLPAEKTLFICQPTVDNQALLPVVHAEGTHGAAAINRLKPKLADSKTGPVIEL